MPIPPAIAREAIRIKNELNEFDRQYWSSDDSGYCKHGTYVGGCGIDWMCGHCESGYSNYEIALAGARQLVARKRKAAYDKLWDCMLKENADLWEVTTKEEQKTIIHAFTGLLEAVKSA